jgi:hypothetical protein
VYLQRFHALSVISEKIAPWVLISDKTVKKEEKKKKKK